MAVLTSEQYLNGIVINFNRIFIIVNIGKYF